MIFICENCGSTSFDQVTRTQVRCHKCGHLSKYDTGGTPKQYELSPDTTMLDFSEKGNYIMASLLMRFANFLVDQCVLFALIILVGYLFFSFKLTREIAENTILAWVFTIIFFYYSLMEYAFGKTIGKFLTSTKVISTSNKHLSFKLCMARTFCRFIPFNHFSGLFTEGVFWHDSIPNTLVIEDDNL